MALNLATVAAKKLPLVFEFEGETVKANYYPNRMTPEFRARLNRIDRNEAEPDEQARGSAVKLVAELLAPDWDVMAGDEPFLPTAERTWLETLCLAPQGLISVAIKAISESVGEQTSGETES